MMRDNTNVVGNFSLNGGTISMNIPANLSGKMAAIGRSIVEIRNSLHDSTYYVVRQNYR